MNLIQAGTMMQMNIRDPVGVAVMCRPFQRKLGGCYNSA